MEMVSLSWDDIMQGADNLALQLIESGFLDEPRAVCIVPIVRGGLPLGTILSHKLNGIPVCPVTFQTRDGDRKEGGRLFVIWKRWKKLIIVDDIIDTGKTMDEINIRLNDICDGDKNQEAVLATFCKRSDLKYNGFKKQFSVYDVTENVDWIKFPWETNSLLTDKNAGKQ